MARGCSEADGGDDASAPAVLRAAVGSTRATTDLIDTTVRAALAWVAENPRSPGAGPLLRATVGSTRATPERVAEAVEAALDWVRAHPDDAEVPGVLRASIGGTRIPRASVAAPAAVAMTWMAEHPDDPEIVAIFRTVIAAGCLDQARRHAVLVVEQRLQQMGRRNPLMMLANRDRLRGLEESARAVGELFEIHSAFPSSGRPYGVA